MAKIYLAAPFFSDGQHERINQVKEALETNKTVSSIFVPEEHSFTLDINNIYTADAVVAIIDYKKEESDNEADSGTAFEIGLAFGTNTPVIVVQFDAEKELNLMISQALTAYFDASKGELSDLANYDFNELMPKLANRPVI